MKTTSEGVIKFRLEHHPKAAPDAALSAPLRGWFRVLRALDLLGRDPHRYEGCAYGNLSRRLARGILVTCTQTSGKRALSAEDFALATHWAPLEGRLTAQGPCPPSSETLTHAMLYDQLPQARWVFHVHSPVLWRRASALGLAITDPSAEYGTPAMARAVAETLAALGHPPSGLIAMGGHQDGLLAWGPRPQRPGNLLVAALAKALALDTDG